MPFVAPSVKERANEDHSIAVRFVEQLEAGEIEIIVCMTGVGLQFLKDVLSVQMPVERLSAALRKAKIVSRGPKPVPILRSLQVPVGNHDSRTQYLAGNRNRADAASGAQDRDTGIRTAKFGDERRAWRPWAPP